MYCNAYLNFNGQCEEAFHFYQQVLGGEITAMINHTNTPMAAQVPADWGPRIMHARLEVGSSVLMGSDSPPEHYATPAGFAVAMQTDTDEQADRVFAGLAEGGEVRMPIQETFWASRFGMLTDRYGIPWMVNCFRPQ